MTSGHDDLADKQQDSQGVDATSFARARAFPPFDRRGSEFVPKRLLVAAANLTVVDRCRAEVMGLGYHVDTAGDTEECLEKLRRAAPDLLVLDLELPEGEAGQVLHRLREESELAGIAVAVVASVIPISALHQLLVSPIIHYFAKPLRKDGLREWIDCIWADSRATAQRNQVKTVRPHTRDRKVEEHSQDDLDEDPHKCVRETVGHRSGRNAGRSGKDSCLKRRLRRAPC